MRKYLFYKIFIRFAIFSGLFFIIFFIFSLQTFKKIYFLNIEEKHKQLIYKIFNEIQNNFGKRNFNLDDELKKIDRYTGIRITLIKTDGVVINDSRVNPINMENHKNRPEIIDSIEKGEGRCVRLSPTLDKYMFYYAIFFREKGIVIRTSLELSYIQKFISYFKVNFSVLFFKTYLILLLIFLPFLFLQLKEISVIDSFIKDLGKEEKRVRLLSLKQKGLTELVNNLNIISEKLFLFSEIKRRENEIFNIIEKIEEPIGFINLEGKLLTYNSCFKKFLKSSAENKYYWEVIGNFEINEIIEKTINFKNNFEKEIEIDGKWFFLKTKYLEKEKIILLFLVDITVFREIEKIRKEFITNISHELKTPLTIIKGYIETMEEEVKNSEIKNYLYIIKNQTERLIKIVENIIALSSLELKKIDIEDFNISEVIKSVFELYKKKAEEKNIQLLLNLPDSQFFKGDKFRLEQAIINLVDNAIKFTEKGKVEINLYKKGKYVIIEVIDTGIGISKEDLPKVFDKFYVGKKTPKTGTGLGLSIVKNIIELHNGKIEVESELNKGTKFTIYLPH
ncbi:MAG: ATP-binding protein [Candidatus Omnitrophica bacterium]|nr:ATP-binding protein [Candidatus Omnitrophota bacterium]